jgi:hypothetical protein
MRDDAGLNGTHSTADLSCDQFKRHDFFNTDKRTEKYGADLIRYNNKIAKMQPGIINIIELKPPIVKTPESLFRYFKYRNTCVCMDE